MEIRDLYTRYGALNNIVISRKQKIRYLTTLQSDFKEIGYEDMEIYKTKIDKKESIIGIVGNLKTADSLVMTHYDTPLLSYLWKEHDPFNDDQLRKKARVNYIIPMVLLFIILLAFAYIVLIPTLGDGNFSFLDIVWTLVALVIMYLVVKVTQYSGIPKRNNLTRNTSSVVALIKFAASLNKKNRKNVAFAFVDYGNVDYFGYMILAEIIEHNHKKTIMLDSIGKGNLLIENNKSNLLSNKFKQATYIYGIGNEDQAIDSNGIVEYYDQQTEILIKTLNQQLNI